MTQVRLCSPAAERTPKTEPWGGRISGLGLRDP